MNEIIVRLCRAIASRPRLRILSHLAQHGEAMPTRLQTELGLPLNTLSQHLRALSVVGLIRSRRSGVRCYYEFRSPYNEQTLSGRMSKLLKKLLEKPAGGAHCELHEVRNDSSPPAMKTRHDAVFDAATAFTDLRRLQILQYLQTHPQATAQELISQLKMSGYAVSRQTAKLRRRGFLVPQRIGSNQLAFRLSAQCKTRIHGRMLEIVRAADKKQSLRTS
jgi:DNA-binding transcriptional ArsR family regulator